MCSMQGVQNQGCSEGMDAALASTVNRTAGLLCPQFELTFGLLCIQETVPLPYLFMNPKLSPHMRSWLSQRSWVQLLTYATSRIPLGSCWIRKDKSPSTLVLDWKQAGGLSKVREHSNMMILQQRMLETSPRLRLFSQPEKEYTFIWLQQTGCQMKPAFLPAWPLCSSAHPTRVKTQSL